VGPEGKGGRLAKLFFNASLPELAPFLCYQRFSSIPLERTTCQAEMGAVQFKKWQRSGGKNGPKKTGRLPDLQFCYCPPYLSNYHSLSSAATRVGPEGKGGRLAKLFFNASLPELAPFLCYQRFSSIPLERTTCQAEMGAVQFKKWRRSGGKNGPKKTG
jgi:hypothetical protein